jgi:transcriptional regulator with XRE-family HTH domain
VVDDGPWTACSAAIQGPSAWTFLLVASEIAAASVCNISVMAEPAAGAVDIAELAALLHQRRMKAGLSLRELSAEIGVPFATLSRVESGRLPDLTTFRSIVDWIGVPPERFFPTSRVRNETTPEAIAMVLRSDSALTDQAREQLTSTIEQMYTVLTVNSQIVRMQLRSHGAFSPEAGDLLADLLRRMQEKLLEQHGGPA